jgi:hypothetical protein
MSERSLAEIARPEAEHSTAPVYRVLYDGQCEICQACVSWLKALDHENKTICLPISAEVLSAVDSRLQTDACASCMSSLPKVKSMSGGMPSRVWHVYSRLLG